MPLPAGVELVTVSSGQPLALYDGTLLQGSLTFTGPALATIGGQDVTLGGERTVELVDGQFTVSLVATDATGMSPTGWTYKVIGRFTNAPGWTRYVSLPKAAPSVRLADVLVPDPVAGTYSVLVDVSTTGLVRTSGDQVISGTKTFNDAIPVAPGFDPEFDNQLARKRYVDTTVAAAGGGSSIRTATLRVADGDALATLAPAASWAIVQSSAGTPCKASITASAGDRIVAHPAFMRTPGPHFLDLALLNSGGSIAVYAGSRTSSPLVEGNPTMYPSGSFAYAPGSVQFVVSSGHIDGTGKATVALVHKGTETTMKVYCTPDYPLEMRLENLGPEPA